MPQTDMRQQRLELVEQIERLGVRDPAVLEAMRSVPREEFVPDGEREFAYRNVALPIEEGQTISQPLVVASMAEAMQLRPTDRVLEVGAGSGYAAAVLSLLASEVYAIERHQALAESARRRLESLGYDNVHVLHGDGTRGWPDRAPFDAITVAAAGPEAPRSLLEQLSIGGRLVMPVGDQARQELMRIRRVEESRFKQEHLGAVQFVPLIGEEGWPEEDPGALLG